MGCIKTYFAKNGKPSILFDSLRKDFGENRAEEIYLKIHAPQFKQWFGDWESGKAGYGVDENGEPQIYWHGTNQTRIESFISDVNYFTTDKSSADLIYAAEKAEEGGQKTLYPVFIKIDGESLEDRDITILDDQIAVKRLAVSNVKSIFDNEQYSSLTDNIYKSKVIPEEVAYNLTESSKAISSPEGTNYTVAGRAVPRVSTITDRKVPYKGTKSGKDFEDKGTRYHAVVQDIIEGVNNKSIVAKWDLTDQEMGFLISMRTRIDAIKSKGGVVLSEKRIANTTANSGEGVAGTLDIIHIRPDGFADIYDIKTAHETDSKRQSMSEGNSSGIWDVSDFNYYKAERYAHQLGLYGKMLSTTDEVTGRRGIPVKDVFVIPVEVSYDTDGSTVRGVDVLKSESIKSWKVGKRYFHREAKRWADNVLSGKKTQESVIGLEGASTVDEFLPKALGVNLGERDTARSARNFVENHSKQKTFNFNDKSYSWASDEKEERIEQVKELMDSSNDSNARIVSSTSLFFNGEVTGIFKTMTPDGPILSPMGQRLSKIISTARAVDIIALSSIRGFEDYDDISLVKRPDGSYDLLKMTYESLDKNFDISKKETNIVRNVTGMGTDSVFGNRITPSESRSMKVKLNNTIGDYHRMRLGLIGMEIASINPDMKINRIIVDSYSNKKSDVSSRAIPASEIVQHIKTLYKLPDIAPLASGSLKDILDNEESYNMGRYVGDPVEDLMDYMTTQLTDDDLVTKQGKPTARAKIQASLLQYKQNDITKQNLIEELMNGVRGLQQELRLKYVNNENIQNLISSDPESMMLASAILSLSDIMISPEKNITDEFAGFLSKYYKAPYAMGRQTMDKTFDIVRQSYDDIKRDMIAFNTDKLPHINKLIRQSPLFKRGLAMDEKNIGGSDAIFGMGQSVFDNLFQNTVDKNGKKGRTLYLKAEGSQEFNNLSVAEQDFIRYFNRTLKKYDENWPTGLVPLLSVSSNTLLYRGKQQAASANLMAGSTFLDATIKEWGTLKSRGTNILDERGSGNTIKEEFPDRFGALLTQDKSAYLSEVLAQYGLDPNMNLVDAKKNDGFETNLEEILTRFASSHIKKKHYDKVLPYYQVMRSIFKLYEIAYGFDQKDTIEVLDDYVKDIVFNIKQSEDTIITGAVTFGVNTASIALLGLNAKVFLNNAVQMWSSGIVDSLTNTFSKDPRFPGISHFTKAGIIMTGAMNPTSGSREMHKLRLLKEMYLPDDLTVLSGKRHKKTASGMINSQLAFAMDRITEHGVRTQHLIAQMLKDGTYDAHDIVQEMNPDGFYRWKIVYDPKKDPRFKGEDGKLLYDVLKESEADKGELNDDGELSMAYDWKLRRRLHAYINRQIGAFDRDLTSHIGRFSLAYSLTQFRTWFRDKLVRNTKLEYDNDTFGQYVKVGDNIVWEKDTMKGVLWTLADLYSIGRKFAKKEKVDQTDIRNMILAGNTLGAMAVMALLVAAIWEDEDDIPAPLQSMFDRYYSDMLSFITLEPVANISQNPFVFVSFYQRLFSVVGKSLVKGVEGETDEALNSFYTIIPIVNQLPVNE